MRHYDIYRQSDALEVRALTQDLETALLLTTTEKADVQSGVFNPVIEEDCFWLHLHREDEQVATLRRTPLCHLVFQDMLAVIPSHWVDERYGGAATSYYRFADFTCAVKLIEAPVRMIPVLPTKLKDGSKLTSLGNVDVEA